MYNDEYMHGTLYEILHGAWNHGNYWNKLIGWQETISLCVHFYVKGQ